MGVVGVARGDIFHLGILVILIQKFLIAEK
jgi:hypothetical protein